MTKRSWRPLICVFIVNALCAAMALMPYAISNGGILTLCEDFNAETVPYYYMLNRAVRSGSFAWNWGIDIGSDFMASFGTMLCSPFNWIVVLIPESWIPYASVWILILKYATAGLTAYIYIRRYTKRMEGALLGSVLYAFSGYQLSTLVFNVFDSAVFFPLMLYTLDRLVLENRRGGFALAVWINACVSFSLFVQSALLCVLYFILRFWWGNWKAWRKIGFCMLEAVIGVGMASFVFVRQAYDMMGNTRAADKLSGSASLTFSTLDVLQTIRAWLFPADTMSNGSALMETDWTDNAGYLPLVGVTLAVAFARHNRGHWLRRCLMMCLVIAFVPALNNIFTFEASYAYRRWYYFPTLMAALATGMFVEKEESASAWKESAGILALIAGFTLFVELVPWDGVNTVAVYDFSRYTIEIVMAVAGVIATAAICRFVRHIAREQLLLACVVIAAVLVTYNTVGNYQLPSDHGVGENGANTPQAVVNEWLNTNDLLEGKEIWPNRVVYWNNYYNYGMIDGLCTRMAFHSLVNNSISEFYAMMGTPRNSAMSPYGPSGTDELLSVRYFVLNYDLDTLVKVGEKDNGNYTVRLYEDPDALPIGFCYDTYMTRSEFVTYPAEERAAVMMRTLIIKDEDVDKVSDILPHYDAEMYGVPTLENFKEYKLAHKEESAKNHQMSTNGSFSVDITTMGEKYAFFSVPYDENWSAKVNGEYTEILNINGLMAVRVPYGDSRIDFEYSSKVTMAGLVLSGAFILAFAIYLAIRKIGKSRRVCLH